MRAAQAGSLEISKAMTSSPTQQVYPFSSTAALESPAPATRNSALLIAYPRPTALQLIQRSPPDCVLPCLAQLSPSLP